MSITRKQFEDLVQRIAPLQYAYDWDNSGTTLAMHDKVEKILVCLDVDDAALSEAEALGCDTILSHHPLIFHPLKKLRKGEPVEEQVIRAVQLGFNLYAAHTSSDRAPDGLNRALAEALALKNQRLFCQEEDGMGIGVIGELEADLDTGEFAQYVGRRLDAKAMWGGAEKRVRTVACIGGAAGGFFLEAARLGADAFVTGEAKYNQFLDAQTAGVALVAAGHYHTERVFVAWAADSLQRAANALQYNIQLCKSERMRSPYRVL